MVMTIDDVKALPPLTDEEKKIIEDAKPTPTDDCLAMTAKELKEFKSHKSKRTVTINMDNRAIAYFKGLAEETGVPYQTLMNMYLVQCSEEKKRPMFV